jgi:hypothetical protein
MCGAVSFVGPETVLSPSTARELKAAFNKVSNYRDPGRVNINTIPGLAASVRRLTRSGTQS